MESIVGERQSSLLKIQIDLNKSRLQIFSHYKNHFLVSIVFRLIMCGLNTNLMPLNSIAIPRSPILQYSNKKTRKEEFISIYPLNRLTFLCLTLYHMFLIWTVIWLLVTILIIASSILFVEICNDLFQDSHTLRHNIICIWLYAL